MPVNSHAGNKTITPYCYLCKNIKETQDHFLYCQHIDRQQTTKEEQEKLLQQLQKIPGDQQLIRIIHDTCIKNNNDTIPYTKYPQRYKQIIQVQNKIGWTQIRKGRIAKLS